MVEAPRFTCSTVIRPPGGRIAILDPADPLRPPEPLCPDFHSAKTLVALPDGNLAAAYQDAVRLFDTTTGQEFATFADTVRGLAVSTGEDGQAVLAMATSNGMSSWSI